MHAARVGIAVLTLALAAEVNPQVPIWTRQGTPLPAVTLLTGPLAAIGDVNGDGYGDLLQFVGGSLPLQGLWIFSGRDGATLRIRPPVSPYHAVRTIASAGDVDGDGIGDYALGLVGTGLANYTDLVQVRSARDDRLLWESSGSWYEMFAFHLAGDLDVDGDRRPDLVVSAERAGTRLPNQPWPGAIHVYSNQGSLLYTIANLPGIYYLGRSLAKVGDVDGDGCDDFVAGAVESYGVVLLFSGRTGSLLRKVYGEHDGIIGWSVTGCGDLDGDGVPDFAAGTAGGFGERGMVRAFSGRTGHTLYTWWSPSQQQYGNSFGYTILGGTDVNRDGVPDLLIAASDFTSLGPSFMSAYSGRDGSRIFRLQLEGLPVADMRPQPGNPFPLFATLTTYIPSGTTTLVGQLTVYRASPAGVEPFGISCSGTLPSEPAIGIHALDQGGARFHLSGGEPAGCGVLLLGLSRTSIAGWPLPFPLSSFGFQGCLLFTSVEASVAVVLGSSGNAAGYGFVDLPLSLSATGVPVHGQWVAVGTGVAAPGGVSDALLWRH